MAQREEAIVWLLAARYHRSGEKDDAYPFMKTLDTVGRLLPTEDDYLVAIELEEKELPAALHRAAQQLLDRGHESPGREVRDVIGGTFRVSVVVEKENGLAQVWLAVSQRLIEGEIQPPPEWLRLIVAAFFPGAPFDALQSPSELFPTRSVAPDEIVFTAVTDS